MTSEALRLAYWLERDGANCQQHINAAAELRRQHEECNDLAHQLNQSNERNGQLMAQRDALLRILKSELQHAEWQDKIIYPVGSEDFQNWKISIYLPVPLSASDKSPQAALDRLVDADIKAAEDGS